MSPIRVWLSSLTVSLLIQIESFVWVVTFWDQGKRLSFLLKWHPCMPIVTHVTGHSSRGTRILPCAPVVMCVRVREGTSIKRENATRCCVFDRTEADTVGLVWQSERMKEFDGGRRPTKGRSGTKGEMNRQIIQESQQIMRTQRSISSVGNERLILLFNSTILQADCHFVEEFFNFEPRMNSNQIQPSHRGTEKQRDLKCSWWEIKENRQEQDSRTAKVQRFVAPHLFSH